MKAKLSSFGVTSELKNMEQDLIDKSKSLPYAINKVSIHKNAIRNFYNSGNWDVLPQLKITTHSHPEYVKRDDREQVYLDQEMREMLQEMADYNHCTLGTVFFHALLIYITKEYKNLLK